MNLRLALVIFTCLRLCLSVLPVLDQILMELHRFLLILDRETLTGSATAQKGLLSDLLQSYKASNGMGFNQNQMLRKSRKSYRQTRTLCVVLLVVLTGATTKEGFFFLYKECELDEAWRA